MAASDGSLYARLGGYDAIAAVVDDLLTRLRADPLLGRFWSSPRSDESNRRERQMAVDFLCASAGGPVLYLGRDMKTAHKGMGITRRDWEAFVRHLGDTLAHFKVPERERAELNAFIATLERDVVEK